MPSSAAPPSTPPPPTSPVQGGGALPACEVVHRAEPRDAAVLAELALQLEQARLADQRRLGRDLERLRRAGPHAAADATLQLQRRIAASAAQVRRLASLPLRLQLDPALPISAHRQEIGAALERHAVLIVCGATGSGKSTQLPKLALAMGRGARALIGHTQPRRIAARALAARLAEELGTSIGAAVGYQVRFAERVGPDTRVKLMTDGILLRELARDRDLRRYDTLIIDEAHERTLNIDLLLGVVRTLVARRPELRVIITSATLEAERLASYLDGAPIIEVRGRSYPVEVRYRPLAADEDTAELTLPEAVVAAVRELGAEPRTARGDVLVFLPGEQHIREAYEALRQARLDDTDAVPLFARLSSAEQERIFASHSRRRVVLATNVAETSLTVPGIRHVIDSGLARISRYSPRGKLQRLPIEPISRASAEQRKGRCGREAEGVCIRLYSQPDFEQREAFTPPEILRTNLASVILQMAVSGLGDIASFAFLDAPDARAVQDGVRLLQELEAMDEAHQVTATGRRMAVLPCDPRLGRMLIAAASEHCLTEMLIIVAFLAIPDPRERPAAAAAQADAHHAGSADARSDFRTVLRLWHTLQREAAVRTRGELRKWCRESFLSFVRVREWQDLQRELADAARELGLTMSRRPASYAALHRAVLSGFASCVGVLEERREYRAPRGARFVIAPGTPLATRPPRWVVAASLIETTRTYARMVASVEPAWIERAAAHLVRRTYSEPHWSAAQGEVLAFETISLYGLALIARRRVSYARIAPAQAHEIFIREALVAGRSSIVSPSLEANRALRAGLEQLEAKIRRRDILVDEQHEVDFYRERIPEAVSSTAAFERWLVGIERHQTQRLRMTAADLMCRPAEDAAPEHFPDALRIGADALPLRYVFDPGAPDDGATLLAPEALIDRLDPERLAWQVPGRRLERLTELLRALPKSLRRKLVPLPEQARAALVDILGSSPASSAELLPEPPFHAALALWLTRRTGEPMSAAELVALPLPPYLSINVRVLDTAPERGAPAILAEGRDVRRLKEQLRGRRRDLEAPPERAATPSLHRTWDFGELPQSVAVSRGGIRYQVYPTLEAHAHGVALAEAPSRAAAEQLLRRGVARLAALALAPQARELRRRVSLDRELVLLAQGAALERPLPEMLIERAFEECFAPPEQPVPRNAGDFEARIAAARGELEPTASRLTESVRALLRAWRPVRAALASVRPQLAPGALADIDGQLAALLPADFLRTTPQPWLAQLPRYLHALGRRLERLPAQARRDAELSARVAPFVRAYQELRERRLQAQSEPSLEQLRWMIEEFRVSLFAQELKTLMPVSAERLAAQLRSAERATPEA